MKKSAFSLVELSVVLVILGIVMAGVSQGSRLIAQYRITTAQNITKGSPIISMPGVALWLETTMDTAVTSSLRSGEAEDNDPISSWNDYNQQTLTRINVTQATSNKMPIYITSGIGNLPSIKFDGVNDLLRTASGGAVPISAGDGTYTIIAVFQYNTSSVASAKYVLYQGDASASTNKLASLYLHSGTMPSVAAGFVGASNNFYTTSGVVTVGSPYIAILRINNSLSTNNISLFFNTNTAVNGTSSGTGPAGLNIDNTVFQIGLLTSGANEHNPFSGLISEIIIFDRNLKNSEIADINSYLSKKYSIRLQ